MVRYRILQLASNLSFKKISTSNQMFLRSLKYYVLISPTMHRCWVVGSEQKPIYFPVDVGNYAFSSIILLHIFCCYF